MNIKFGPAVLIGALLSIPVAGYAQDTPKTIVKDSVITTKIKAEQAKDPLVGALRINVETDNSGKVVLSGNAKSQAEIDRAVQIAKGVQGVTSVQNNMTLAGAAAGTTATRVDPAATAGTRAATTTAATTPARAPRADRN